MDKTQWEAINDLNHIVGGMKNLIIDKLNIRSQKHWKNITHVFLKEIFSDIDDGKNVKVVLGFTGSHPSTLSLTCSLQTNDNMSPGNVYLNILSLNIDENSLSLGANIQEMKAYGFITFNDGIVDNSLLTVETYDGTSWKKTASFEHLSIDEIYIED